MSTPGPRGEPGPQGVAGRPGLQGEQHHSYHGFIWISLHRKISFL